MSKLAGYLLQAGKEKIFKTSFSDDGGLHNSPIRMLPIFKPEEDIIQFLEVVFF